MAMNFFENLEWRSAEKGRERSNADVSIREVLQDRGRRSLSFTFRNDVYKLITENERIEFARNKCVILFRDAKNGGFKLSAPKNNKTQSTKYMKVAMREGDEELIGDYDLLYEEKFDVYYIDLEEKR